MANSQDMKNILDDFDNYLPKFKKIIPADYKKMIGLTAEYMEQGMDSEKAQIEAFYTSLGKEAK